MTMIMMVGVPAYKFAILEAKVQLLCMFGDPMCVAVWLGPCNRKRGGRRGLCYVIGYPVSRHDMTRGLVGIGLVLEFWSSETIISFL